MDIKALTIFMEVAELGSFTKVGEKLGYSQPTISFQIKQLEKELGVSAYLSSFPGNAAGHRRPPGTCRHPAAGHAGFSL